MGGARALGLDREIGSIEAGKRADLVVLDYRAFGLTPTLDPDPEPRLSRPREGRGDRARRRPRRGGRAPARPRGRRRARRRRPGRRHRGLAPLRREVRRHHGGDSDASAAPERRSMASAAELRARIKVCMFDQYGTVVDMQAGLTAVDRPVPPREGLDGRSRTAFVTWWRRTHFENSMIDALLQREHTPVPGDRPPVAGLGPRARRDPAHAWTRCATWWPRSSGCVRFRRSPPPSPASSAGSGSPCSRTAIPDMLEAAKPHHGIPFDAVISAAVANAFKPHVATYTRAAEIMGVPMHEVLFVANHAFDCIGAKSAGHARRVRRPPQAALRRDAAPARPHRRRHDGARGCPRRARTVPG